MIRILLLFTLTFFSLSGLLAQQRSAVHPHDEEVSGLTRMKVSADANGLLKTNGYQLDHGSTDQVSFIYGDERLTDLLEKAGFVYEAINQAQVMEATVGLADVASEMASNNCFVPLDAYPSYDLYEELMTGFAENFPQIAVLHELGTLPSGRKILALEITDNPHQEEVEPKLLYTSSMHGDELGGYHVTLRLIADLLCSYGNDAELTNLINTTEIWINPLANPDGAYRNNNAAIINPSRGNANFVDLNRNYPDPDDGDHPDGQAYQPETEIFMAFSEQYRFDLSMNIHGGAEVFNYPWDTYPERTADNDWWIHVGREYADGCQQAADYNGYMDALDNGITNGYDWYPIYGGRQDFVTYFHRGREATLEISNIKTTPPGQFADIWNYNRLPLINFLKQGTYGLQGRVTDSLTTAPIEASVFISNYDELNSDVMSKLPTGRYHRYLKTGTYTVLFSAEGYHPKLVTYELNDQLATPADVRLSPLMPAAIVNINGLRDDIISANYQDGGIYIRNLPLERDNWKLQLLDMEGREITHTGIPDGQREFSLNVGYLKPGIYLCRILGGGEQQVVRFSSVVKKK